MDREDFTNAVVRMRNESVHAEEHRQEMIDIAKQVVNQYVNTTLMQTIRQMVEEAIAQTLRDFETGRLNINYDFHSTVAKQTEKMIKNVFEKEIGRMFKKHGINIKWK
ncbi:hypothetical protein [Massiliimalia massiliensis]|uniref:hypothetical protein n=1 Tax=Massiliimalia massiliensis TaxID=1852384 RepID=UPI00117ABE18|nr:hypothetical protein [Massiliimalia massiliensis]